MTLSLTTRRLLSRAITGGTDYREAWPSDVHFLLFQAAGLISGHVGTSAPGDTTKLWLDTTAGLTSPGTWKYHNGSAWVTTTSTTKVAEHILARGAPGVFVTDGDKGDVVVSASGAVWELDPIAAAARIAASSTAVDSIKDAISGVLEAADARAMVNAIQADATALTDIKSSFEAYNNHGVGDVNNASGVASSVIITLDGTSGVWDVAMQNVGSSAGNVAVAIAVTRNGGSSWADIRSASASNPTTSAIAFRIHAPSGGTTTYVTFTGIDWSGAAFNTSATLTLTHDGSSNVAVRLLAASGNLTYSKLRARRIA